VTSASIFLDLTRFSGAPPGLGIAQPHRFGDWVPSKDWRVYVAPVDAPRERRRDQRRLRLRRSVYRWRACILVASGAKAVFECVTLAEHRGLEKGRAMSENTETAILAGGCFWGVQDLLRRREGVISTRVGYTGGENENPTYRKHPGHAEAVEIVFDPERISYRDILEFFFQIHDPTTKDRQGNDIGSSYRSEIFYTSDEQRQVAEDTIADVDASGLWPGKVVTEISEAVPFWEAESEHQDYLQRYPNGYTCHFPRPGWRLPHRETAA
jgi:peptide-methionine (S)-S-oxide reductase